jgi:hypothetical protein
MITTARTRLCLYSETRMSPPASDLRNTVSEKRTRSDETAPPTRTRSGAKAESASMQRQQQQNNKMSPGTETMMMITRERQSMVQWSRNDTTRRKMCEQIRQQFQTEDRSGVAISSSQFGSSRQERYYELSSVRSGTFRSI